VSAGEEVPVGEAEVETPEAAAATQEAEQENSAEVLEEARLVEDESAESAEENLAPEHDAEQIETGNKE